MPACISLNDISETFDTQQICFAIMKHPVGELTCRGRAQSSQTSKRSKQCLSDSDTTMTVNFNNILTRTRVRRRHEQQQRLINHRACPINQCL